jgi:tetratricopeptide (TPR) repeat protein
MGYIERYLAAFPESRFQEQVTQLAIFTLGQLNDASRLASFGEKALAANPKSVATLVMLAEAFGESSATAYAARGEGYARKALDLVKTQSAADKAAAQPVLDADKARLYSGLAHSAMGYALMKEGKDAASIAELKTATAELKGNADNYSTALYRLGFVYAKTGKLVEAKASLAEVAGMRGPFQQPARDLLAKVEAAIKAGPTKKGR